jgi:hypothetical protein
MNLKINVNNMTKIIITKINVKPILGKEKERSSYKINNLPFILPKKEKRIVFNFQ